MVKRRSTVDDLSQEWLNKNTHWDLERIRSSAVIENREFKSEDPGFDPFGGAECGAVCFCPFQSTLVLMFCLCLTTLRVYGTHPNMYAR